MNLLTSANTTILAGIKLGVLSFLLVYTIFAFVVIKQVKLMTDTLEVGFEKQLRLVSYIHLVLSAFVLVLAVFVM